MEQVTVKCACGKTFKEFKSIADKSDYIPLCTECTREMSAEMSRLRYRYDDMRM